jgi:hypothetical protein
MGKNKPDGKAKGKGSQLVIRIDKAERAAFVSLCEDLDTSAAREIRRFMRGFVATHAQRQPAAPADLPEPEVTPVTEMAETGPGPLVLKQPIPPTEPDTETSKVA